MGSRPDEIQRVVSEVCLRGEMEFVERDENRAASEDAARDATNENVARVAHIVRTLDRAGVRSGKLLEIGIGYGYVAFSIARLFPELEVHATEHPGRSYLTSPPFLSDVRKNHVRIATMDFSTQAFPWPDGYFDVVIFSEVLEHVSPTLVPGLLAEFRRLLRLDGLLLVTSPNFTSLVNRIMLLFGRTGFLELPEPKAHAAGTFGHIRIYSVGEVLRLAQGAGYELADVTYVRNPKLTVKGQTSRQVARRFLLRAESLLAAVGMHQVLERWCILLSVTPRQRSAESVNMV